LHLRLDHPALAAERLRRRDRFIGAGRDTTVGDWNAVTGENPLRLIFVQIHPRPSGQLKSSRLSRKPPPEASALPSNSRPLALGYLTLYPRASRHAVIAR